MYISVFANIFPYYADKQPFASTDSLSRVALDAGEVCVATCLALDKAKDENATFVSPENRDILLY
jgi:hypothetical protein